ncbi:MAG TPA: division/cell wall cluster transcriptional repressor MraZ [Ignavibacteria bacterium]|nr:division/cell wall cluster transcriptional repressor MraZ [Bacteroidota bacterium]HRI84569.1 division/cell wall cluster transcriptional repressor MraZ [Ignavibacteria bacterium]HRJ98888.1 division/cell wall cluster transcriptional repressor MraZ [Ignavibacteria bacterium]
MFQGHSVCNLDAKSRLILPAKFRKYIKPEADNKLVLTKGMDDCLLVYPQDEWEKVKQVMLNFNPFNGEERNFTRVFLYYANECELDSQNRILIPTDLIQLAGLKKEVIVLGLLDKMEIWDPDKKKNYDNSMTSTYEEIAEKVSEIIIARTNNKSQN